MHLRSGTTIASGSQVPSKASTRSSKNLAAKDFLDPIIEDYKTTSSSEESESISSMSNQFDESHVDLLGNPTTRLVFKYVNDHGGRVFTNDLQECAIWENSQGGVLSPPATVEVTDHGDHYMDSRGFKFLKTMRSNEMDSWGNLRPGLRALSEPYRTSRPGFFDVRGEVQSHAIPAPSAPPLVHLNVQQGSPLLYQEAEAMSRPHTMRPASPSIPKASVQGKLVWTCASVSREFTDQTNLVLYKDTQSEDRYITPMMLNRSYPMEMTMNIYELQGGQRYEYLDDWGTVYTKALYEDVKDLTWQGVPISLQRRGMSNPQPTTAQFRHVESKAPPSLDRSLERAVSMENLCGSMSHINLDDRGMEFQ